ncbi:MAG: FAD-binding protein [Provencibacterium sp.]|jgi:succinate dehydrogenase/fumarate reductase flavoprotein subunit|nr:FAD-binding protein [Provencibacterium sp.]
MQNDRLTLAGKEFPVISVDTLIVGTGCAGYNAADWLYELGRRDIALISEGERMGTSRNTGSDKQTYYKLSLCGDEPDSVLELAKTLFSGGGVDGDTALCEAAGSVRSFIKLCMLGVPFPQNEYGAYAGYKTDHDPRTRATSAGPLTSRFMTEALEKSVKSKDIPVYDGMQAVKLLTEGGAVCGLLAIDLSKLEEETAGFTFFWAQNIILATGGPAGLYAASVYPESQTGMSGMALEAGAAGQSLEQWQYGLASIDFRWNVSGTYQQVLPRYISMDEEGNEHEFLPGYFSSPTAALDAVFLKGYQWPFDVRKLPGSSLIDLIVHHETQDLHRRVYMDFTRDPSGLQDGFEGLSEEAYTYLSRSGALMKTPIARLLHMNPAAVELYRSHGIDLAREPLRIAVCAQHCNGGIAVDKNWQSAVKGLYTVGEAAGTFGVYRPGGSALNATQVGSMRAAEHIAYTTKQGMACTQEAFAAAAGAGAKELIERSFAALAAAGKESNVRSSRSRGQERMSRSAAHIRSLSELSDFYADTLEELKNFWENLRLCGCQELPHALRNRDILITRAAVLSAMCLMHEKAKSIGAGMLCSADGAALPGAPDGYRMQPGEGDFSGLHTSVSMEKDGVSACLTPVRPIPQTDDWFENVWREYRQRTGQ